MSVSKITIVLPCYRPSAGWQQVVVDSIGALKEMLRHDIELIVVDDGNFDKNYFNDLSDLKGVVDEFEFISYDDNRGKGYALRRGVEQASGDYIIYTDVDMPYTVDSIYKIIQRLDEGNYLVVGIKDEQYYEHTPAARKFMSKVLRFFIKTFLNLPITDTQCGLKGFRREVKPLFLNTTIDRYLFDIEFIRAVNASKYKTHMVSQPVGLKDGVTFSKMNNKVLLHEAINFMRLYFRLKPKVD